MKLKMKFAKNYLSKQVILSLAFTFVFILIPSFILAQGGTVTGVVSDEFGAPLPGVSVVVEGTTTGVSTDFDGVYTINLTGQRTALVFSYIGYLTQRIESAGRSTINVQMNEDVQSLQEVVVVGYGTQRKSTLTGAVATTTGEALEKSAAPNLGVALAGKVPGLFIDTGNAAPGAENTAIRVRGTNTFNNSSALIVIDGIPARAGGIERINPADIESISVLKDASAAIYGARAANGVILVTTKRGKVGAPTVKLNSSYGLQNFTTTPNMLRGGEYMDLVNILNVYKLPVGEWQSAHAGRGEPYTRQDNGEVVNPTFTNDRIANTILNADPWLYPDTDWMREVTTKGAPISRQNIQVSGGSEDVRYLASLGALSQDVNFKNAPKPYEQYDFRINLDANISKHLSMQVGLYGRQEENYTSTNSPSGVFNDLVRQYPWFPAFWPTGEFGPDIENGNNPAIRVTDGPGFNDQQNTFVQSNMALILNVPGVEGLQLQGNISYDKSFRNLRRWERPWTLFTWDGVNRNSSGLTPAQRGPGDPSLRQTSTTNTDFTATFTGSYEKDLGNHYFKLLGGVTQEKNEQQFFGAFKRFFLSSELSQLDLGGQEGQSNQGNGFEAARLNYFGRLNYAFKNKYLLEFLFRYDGSYLFPQDNRFGFFPGVSAGYVITEEPFFKKALPFIDYLKFRGSWGQMGNDQVGRFQYLNAYALSQTGLETVVTTAFEQNVANPNITWETATSTNIGADFRFLNDKINLSVEYFKNSRDNILTTPELTLPDLTGITPPAVNIGKFDNTGYEITLGLNGGNDKGFNYSTSVNFSDTNNKLIFFDEPALDDRPWQRQQGGELGRPLLYRFDGVFRSQAEIDANTLDYSPVTPILRPGDARVVDVNGDGRITPDDRARVGGSPFADTQIGWNTSLNYKNFDFNMFWLANFGAWNTYEWSFMSGTLANVQRDVRDRAWSLDNPNAYGPRLADRGDQWYSGRTDAFLIKRDFARLKTLEFGYTFDKDIIGVIGAENLRLSVIGTNMITITDFPFDPEVSQSGINITDTRNATGAAVNNGGAYPLTRTVLMAVQITF